MLIVHENSSAKFEKCRICGMRARWNVGYKGRTDNLEYLKLHVRNFAQPNGATKRVYKKIYEPETCIIHL